MRFHHFLLSAALMLSLFSCKTSDSADTSDRDESTEIREESKEEPVEESRQAEALDTDEMKENQAGTFILDDLFQYNSEAELIAAFGDEAKRSIGYLPEGMGQYANTLLYSETPNQVEFVWKDDTVNFNELVYVEVYGGDSDWETKEGIKIGTTLKELEAINKQPFIFSGFEWDYAGSVYFEEGALADRKLGLALTYPDDEYNEALIGDEDFNSDSPLAQKSNLTVGMIRLGNPQME